MDTRLQIAEAFEPNQKHLTQVEILYSAGLCNHRLLFGHPAKTVEKAFIYGQLTRKIAYFKPGDIFALELWECNDYGTKRWDVFVLQAPDAGEMAAVVPQVKPTAKILLEAHGKERAKRALNLLAEIAERADPTTLCPTRFLLTDFRLKSQSPTRTRRNAK